MSRKTVTDRRISLEPQARRWRLTTPMTVALALLVVGALLSWLALSEAQPAGRIVAETTRYDAGKASMRDGLITATFPLTIEGDILIAKLEST